MLVDVLQANGCRCINGLVLMTMNEIQLMTMNIDHGH